MHKGKKAAAIAALAAGATLAASSPAMAFSGWDTQLGPSGSGCYAYMTHTSNIVTPHLWQQSGDHGNTCVLRVFHVGHNWDGSVAYYQPWGPAATGGPSTGVTGPSWYYGPWNGNGYMCVNIDVQDNNGDIGSHGNDYSVCS